MTPSLGPSATGSSTAKPRPSTGPPSAWMSTATSACASLMMAARVVTHGPTPSLLGRVSTTVAPSASRSPSQVARHVEVELRLGVAAGGLRPGGVAGLVARPVEDGLVDDAGCAVVEAVVARVDADHLAGQGFGPDRQPVPAPARRGRHAHHRPGQGGAAQRAEVGGVPVGEDAAVAGDEPVAAAGRRGHADDRCLRVSEPAEPAKAASP